MWALYLQWQRASGSIFWPNPTVLNQAKLSLTSCGILQEDWPFVCFVTCSHPVLFSFCVCERHIDICWYYPPWLTMDLCPHLLLGYVSVLMSNTLFQVSLLMLAAEAVGCRSWVQILWPVRFIMFLSQDTETYSLHLYWYVSENNFVKGEEKSILCKWPHL